MLRGTPCFFYFCCVWKSNRGTTKSYFFSSKYLRMFQCFHWFHSLSIIMEKSGKQRITGSNSIDYSLCLCGWKMIFFSTIALIHHGSARTKPNYTKRKMIAVF